MTDDPLLLVVVGACLVVLIILMIGIGAFSHGGEFNKKHANRLMRYRIIAQAVAILLILGFVTIRNIGG